MAWIKQLAGQIKKHGAENASWYCMWIEPDGTNRGQTCGPGDAGKQAASDMAEKIDSELLDGTYSLNRRLDRLKLPLDTKSTFFKSYGLTASEYNELLTSQNGLCACCGKDNGRRRLNVDHDHKTGTVRGLLCTSCNVGIGALGDSLDGILKAAEYLQNSMATMVRSA